MYLFKGRIVRWFYCLSFYVHRTISYRPYVLNRFQNGPKLPLSQQQIKKTCTIKTFIDKWISPLILSVSRDDLIWLAYVHFISLKTINASEFITLLFKEFISKIKEAHHILSKLRIYCRQTQVSAKGKMHNGASECPK